MDISNLKLIDIQPKIFRNDPFAIAFCEVLEPIFQELSEDVKCVLTYGRIDDLEEEDIDRLAKQFNIDYYQLDIDLIRKRELVKTALKFHKIKGTPGAVKDLGDIIFNTPSEVEEWFNYNRPKFTFRVVIDICSLIEDNLERFCNMLYKVKNVRSHLDGVTAKLEHDVLINGRIKSGVSKMKFCNTFNAGQWPVNSIEGIVISSKVHSVNDFKECNTNLKLVNTFKAGE